jgi:hypothetical protein
MAEITNNSPNHSRPDPHKNRVLDPSTLKTAHQTTVVRIRTRTTGGMGEIKTRFKTKDLGNEQDRSS